MSSPTRCFVAIPLSTSVTSRLVALEPAAAPGIRRVEPDQMHITVRYLGERDLDEVSAVLSELSLPELEVEVGGVGSFQARDGATVLWAGVLQGSGLTELHRAVSEGVAALGIEAERRPYNPHITLAWCTGAADGVVEAFLAQSLPATRFAVPRIGLYTSEFVHGTPIYKLHRAFPDLDSQSSL